MTGAKLIENGNTFFRRHWGAAAALILVALAIVLYAAGVPHNPAGFCLDESSIAYNAHLIATTGHDEYGAAWPLFFRAFGEYKNPTYIYLLAVCFKLTGPSIFVARMLSAVLGAAAALVLGYLAGRITKCRAIAILVAVSSLLTPWLYENSRLVFEVAAYPLLIVIFLLVLYRASIRNRWSALEVLGLALSLSLLTYSYSIGRLLAPLFALGLVFFMQQGRRRGVLLTWLAYAVTLVPLVVFDLKHPGALTNRFRQLTYVSDQNSIGEILRRFVSHCAANINPWRLLMTGEDNLRDHLPGTGVILAVTFLLASAGLLLVLWRHRANPWWRFMVYALVVSIIPASLTTSVFPQIRLVALPVLLHVFTIPAWQGLFSLEAKKRILKLSLIAALAILTVAQGAYFQWSYHWRAPERGYLCDEKFPRKTLAVALSTPRRPVYLFDPPGKSGYVQAYWHGLLSGIAPSQFARLASDSQPPSGATVISTEEECTNCRLLARHLNFIVYTVLPSDLHPVYAPLPDEAFRAELEISGVPPTFRAGQKENVNVLVRNVSPATWPSVGQDDGNYTITVRNRWKTMEGAIVNAADGRKAIFYGLDPADVAGITLPVTAPGAAGRYILEFDVVQEGVAWFSDRGSKSYQEKVVVLP